MGNNFPPASESAGGMMSMDFISKAACCRDFSPVTYHRRSIEPSEGGGASAPPQRWLDTPPFNDNHGRMNLILPDRSLAVFVDDTGHEELVKGHPVYGLGGCAVIAADLDRIIRLPWREVRRYVTGSPDTPLHAADFGQTATQAQIEVVERFFRSQPFARFGATISTDTKLTDEMGAVPTIATVLQRRIIDIAKWTPFSEIHVIFESSDRADELIKNAFQNFNIEEDGRPIPVECYFMPKAAADPALEVADFVMHVVGRQTRKNLQGHNSFALDFKAVFHSVDSKLASFMEIKGVTINEKKG